MKFLATAKTELDAAVCAMVPCDKVHLLTHGDIKGSRECRNIREGAGRNVGQCSYACLFVNTFEPLMALTGKSSQSASCQTTPL